MWWPLCWSERPSAGPRRAAPPFSRLASSAAFLALTAHLFLPFAVTCRTYRSLTLNAPPSCCAGKTACGAGARGAIPDTLGREGVDCPFCKVASPFRHASPLAPFAIAPQWAPVVPVAAPVPDSHLPPKPDLTSAAPRAPPIPS